MNKYRLQKGMGAIGIIFTLIVVVFLILLGMRVIPVYAEYITISRVARYAAQGGSSAEVASRFDNQIRIEGVYNAAITGSDLKVANTGTGTTVTFSYQQEVPLIGDSVSLLFNFNGEEATTGIK